MLDTAISELYKSAKHEIKIAKHDWIKSAFEKYLERRYTKFLTIDTLVFPNRQTLFDILYLPLKLSENEFKEDAEITVVDQYPSSILSAHYRIVVRDNAGMGKSTIAKKVFLSSIRERCAIPILIEVRNLSEKNMILDEIISQFEEIDSQPDKEILFSLIRRGDFTIIFDGLDEIVDENRETVISDIHRFCEKAQDCKFIITSRPERVLSSFGDFKSYTIVPLSIDESFELLNKYDFYSYRKIAGDLVKALSSEQLAAVKPFLTNPFLTSLIYKTYDHKKDIPLKKEQFYRQVYEALYENHDLAKEGYYKRPKHSNLHIDDFAKVLRYVGYKSLTLSKVQFDKEELLEIIDKASRFYVELDFKPSDFLEDLLTTVPLLREEGLSYRWAHKSIQDYFCARFLIRDALEHRNKILRGFLNKGNNDNVVDLYFSMEPTKFRHQVLYPFLTDYIKHYNQIHKKLGDYLDHEVIIEFAQLTYNDSTRLLIEEDQDFPLEDSKDFERAIENEDHLAGHNFNKYMSEVHSTMMKRMLDEKGAMDKMFGGSTGWCDEGLLIHVKTKNRGGSVPAIIREKFEFLTVKYEIESNKALSKLYEARDLKENLILRGPFQLEELETDLLTANQEYIYILLDLARRKSDFYNLTLNHTEVSKYIKKIEGEMAMLSSENFY